MFGLFKKALADAGLSKGTGNKKKDAKQPMAKTSSGSVVSDKEVQALKKELSESQGRVDGWRTKGINLVLIVQRLQVEIKRLDASNKYARPIVLPSQEARDSFDFNELFDAEWDRMMGEKVIGKYWENCLTKVASVHVPEDRLTQARRLNGTQTINSILPAYDTLRLSLANDGLSAAQRDGLVSAIKSLEDAIAQAGGTMIEPAVGSRQDPLDADAILAVPGGEKGTIKEMVSPGIKIGNFMLRPAKVVVYT